MAQPAPRRGGVRRLHAHDAARAAGRATGRPQLGKLRPGVAAARLERALSKQEILEQYLNRAYYGNGAFGVEAARGSISAAGAAPVAGRGGVPRRAAARAARLRSVPRPAARERACGTSSRSMRELGWSPRRRAASPCAMPARAPSRHARLARAPHFIECHQLAHAPGSRAGAVASRARSIGLQQRLEVALASTWRSVGGRGHPGRLDRHRQRTAISWPCWARATTPTRRRRRRQRHDVRAAPGSTLKPFVYALALERGDSPPRSPTTWSCPAKSTRRTPPTSAARLRALPRSARRLLQPGGRAHPAEGGRAAALVAAAAAGVDAPGARPDYDADLAIGDAEIDPAQYAGAFAAFGNAGRAADRPAPSRTSQRQRWRRRAARGGRATHSLRVLSPESPTRSSTSLRPRRAPPDVRAPAPLEVGFPVALKTGTTRGYTDNLAFGTTREFTVGAWAGNFDGTPTDGVMAMQGAAPLVRAASSRWPRCTARRPRPTRRRASSASVCPVSGNPRGPTVRTSTSCSFQAVRRRAAPGTAPPAASRGSLARRGSRVGAGRWATLSHTTAGTAAWPWSPPGRAHHLSGRGGVFPLDPGRAADAQRPPLRARPALAPVRWMIDDGAADSFVPSPGAHHPSEAGRRRRAMRSRSTEPVELERDR